jgi:hypothetical protein
MKNAPALSADAFSKNPVRQDYFCFAMILSLISA